MPSPELGNPAQIGELKAKLPSLRENSGLTALRALGPFGGTERP